MGRQKQNKPRRDRSFSLGPDATGHIVSTVAEAELALYGPGPASDDWQQDVLGRKPLSLRLDRNAVLRINGHPLTEEMCAALAAERPTEAKDFNHARLTAMSRDMVPGLEMRRPAPR
jgi:hypothetical protein